MPTYEYRCENGHTFEQFQKMSDPPVEVCPQCGAAAERLMSAGAGLVFKGSGFYITDYRNENYKKAAESDTGGAAGSAGSSPVPADAPKSDSSSKSEPRSESRSETAKADAKPKSEPAKPSTPAPGGSSSGKSGNA